jgi:hypothetical protein
MAPDNTNSLDRPSASVPPQTAEGTLPTVQIGAGNPQKGQPVTPVGNLPRKTTVWQDLRLPLKWMVTIVPVLFVLIAVPIIAFNAAKGFISGGNASRQKEAGTTATPTTAPTANPVASGNSSPDNGCTDIATRLTLAKITPQKVDAVFYRKYPDRLNKPLNDTTEDRNLRQEWCSIAERLISAQSPR